MWHLSLSPSTSYSMFHGFSLFLSACFQKLPWQFTEALDHFFFFLHFLLFIPLHFLSLSNIYGLLCPPPLRSFFSFSFKHFPMFSSFTVTSFYLDISEPKLCLWEINVSIVHNMLGLFICFSLCVFFLL